MGIIASMTKHIRRISQQRIHTLCGEVQSRCSLSAYVIGFPFSLWEDNTHRPQDRQSGVKESGFCTHSTVVTAHIISPDASWISRYDLDEHTIAPGHKEMFRSGYNCTPFPTIAESVERLLTGEHIFSGYLIYLPPAIIP